MKYIIYPYKIGSKGAKNLATQLNAKRVYPDRNYKNKTDHLVINWGSSTNPIWLHDSTHILNNPNSVGFSVDKIKTLRTLKSKGVKTIPFTENRDEALLWGDGRICERKVIDGSQGIGINIPDTIADIGYSLLYTEFIPRSREYRIHVFNGVVIDVQQKKRRNGSDASGKIKNLANGWVFCRENITTPPDEVFTQAILSIKSLGLDFGAVDIITNNGNVYVLEVNTACGLEGSTLSSYINAIKNYA